MIHIARVLGQFIKPTSVMNVFVCLTELNLFRLTEPKIIMGVDSLSFRT